MDAPVVVDRFIDQRSGIPTTSRLQQQQQQQQQAGGGGEERCGRGFGMNLVGGGGQRGDDDPRDRRTD